MAGRRFSTSPGSPERPARTRAAARSLGAASLFATCVVWAATAESQVAPGGAGTPSPGWPVPPTAAEAELRELLNEQDLYLEVFRGEQATGLMIHVRMLAGRLSAAPASLRAVGIALPADMPLDARGLAALDGLPGLTYQHEQATQRLILRVPPALRPSQRLGYEEPGPVEARRDHGLLLGYDLQARSLGVWRSVTAVGDVRWFGRYGAIEIAGVGRAGAGATSWRRVDARWSYSDPERMWRWTAGDLAGGALPWSRPLRMAGLQWQRSFEVRPGLVRSPIPTFSAEVAEAATVELFVNDFRRLGVDVEDGPLTLGVAPGISGAGRVSMVVTDVLGRVMETSIAFYADHRRLARGLSEFSIEVGLPRRGFLGGSAEYGRSPVASASWRRGVTDSFTLESHGEVGEGLWVMGLGTVWSPGGRWGLVSASIARGEGETRGGRYSLGYQWNTPRYGFVVHTLRSDEGFRDLAGLTPWLPGIAAAPRAQDRASFRLRIPRGGLSLGWQRSLSADGLWWETRSLSMNLRLHPRLSTSVSAFSNDSGGRVATLTASVPLGRQIHASASARGGAGGTSTLLSVRRSAPFGGGVGWSLQGSNGAGGSGRATVEMRGRYAEARFGAEQSRGTTGVSFHGSGSLALMDGRLFLSRRVRDAFAIVSTGGVAGVPILSENRLYGRTGRSGHLLVPALSGWRPHRLAIQPDSLGFGYRIGQLRESVTPADRGGVLVALPVTRVIPAIITLLAPGGEPVPAGRRARVSGVDRELLVGFDGELYLDDSVVETMIELDLSGSRCRYRLPAAPATITGQRRQTLPCEVTGP